MNTRDADRLREHGIQPSAQRVAVAGYVLHTDEHPSADRVLERVREKFPMVSRGTVYNTLHLFVKTGLLRAFNLTGGHLVFDPNVEDHHHFIENESGAIHDIPWDALGVSNVSSLEDAGFQVDEYQVVLRGSKRETSTTSTKKGVK